MNTAAAMPEIEMTDQERELDEGLDYFAKAGQQHAKDIATLSRIEQQRERAFDVPGAGRCAA